MVAFFDELRLNGFIEGKNLATVAGSFGLEGSTPAGRATTVVKGTPDLILAGVVYPRFAQPLDPARAAKAHHGVAALPTAGGNKPATADRFWLKGSRRLEFILS